MAYLDRHRAEAQLTAAGLDALILLSPESFYYASGAAAGVATMWRTAGAVAILIPADANEPEAAIVSDLFAEMFSHHSHIQDVRESPIWVETATINSTDNRLSATDLIQSSWTAAGRKSDFNRPATFDPSVCYQHLSDVLRERNLSAGRIGFEGSALAVNDFGEFREAFPKAELVDATEVLAKIKMVKSDNEIRNLRQAVALAEIGIQHIRDAIDEGVTRNDLSKKWQSAIGQPSTDIALTGAWEYISVGPNPWSGNKAIERGDLIKVDVGCLVDGYTSDTGRTFVFDRPSQVQTELFGALLAGFTAGSALLHPGAALSEVHRVTLAAIRAAGFPSYTRGHFGHGLGAGVGSEQWPFISADAATVFEPGMVMAFECPWYINGLGGMIIENQLLITDDGHEMMNSLPLGLTQI